MNGHAATPGSLSVGGEREGRQGKAIVPRIRAPCADVVPEL